MAYVPVPKDLTKIKSKVMFNLTKRQILCFGGGALIGVPLFYIIVDVAKDLDVFVNKVKKVSSAIDTTKTSTKEAIHKNIRLSRSQGPSGE